MPTTPNDALGAPSVDDVATQLQALASGVAMRDVSTRGRVRLAGNDAAKFLHRMSTNHVEALQPGEAKLNAFPTSKGRFIDVTHHIARADGSVLLVGSEGLGPVMAAWLDKYLFTEAVELSDVTHQGTVLELSGAHAARMVGQLVPGAAELARFAFREVGARLGVRGFDLVDATGVGVPSFLVLDDVATPAALRAEAGALGAQVLSSEAFEVARIAAGVPLAPQEVGDKFNPLDLEMHDAVHWAKGCYIGQEVIARLDTYGKQARRLMGVVLDDDARGRAKPGDVVLVDGASAGELTSVAPLSVPGWSKQATALAMVKVKGELGDLPVMLKVSDGTVVAVGLVARHASQQPHD